MTDATQDGQAWDRIGYKPGVVGATILTTGGTYFDFLHPDLSVITPEDIAAGLSKTCRFAGHTRGFYSVAQHCVLASFLTPIEDRFAALMHDAAEAYLGDVPSPLKRLLPDFRAIEARVEAAIANRFGLPHKMPESVKHADYMLLRRERLDLMPASGDAWPGMENYPLLGASIVPWPIQRAHAAWLDRFRQLAPITPAGAADPGLADPELAAIARSAAWRDEPAHSGHVAGFGWGRSAAGAIAS